MAENTEKIHGGLADFLNPSDFDQRDLMKGIHVELEHTGDILTAMEIAMDHLVEDPAYYDKLPLIHQDAVSSKDLDQWELDRQPDNNHNNLSFKSVWNRAFLGKGG